MANKFRRLMIALLMTATLGTAAKAADAPPRQFRIGFLEAGECIGHAILGNEYLRQLRALVPDSIEIVSVPYAYKSAGWKRDTCRAMAAELATIPELDLVVAMGPWAIEDLLEAGFKRPIVGMYRVDPYAEGLLDSAYRPRVANLTVHARPKIESDMAAIKEIINPSRLGVIYFHSGDERKTVLEHMRQVAGNLGMEIVATEGYDMHGTFAFFKAYKALRGSVDALYVLPFWGMDATKTSEFLNMVISDRVPVFSWEGRHIVDRGAVASNAGYTMVAEALFNAEKTVRIIAGETPADLPIFFADPPGLIVNSASARQSGVSMSNLLLAEAQVVKAPLGEDVIRFDLKQAVGQSLEQSPGFLARYESVEAASQAVGTARSAYLPQLGADFSATHFDDNTVANSRHEIDQDRYAGRILLRQKLFSMETIRNIRSAKQRQDVETSDLRKARLDLELATEVAYLDYISAGERLDLILEHRDQTDRYFEYAWARFRIDSTGEADVVRWEQERNSATANVALAERTLDVARVTLNALLNRPTDEPLAASAEPFNPDRAGFDYTEMRQSMLYPTERARMEEFLLQEAHGNNPALNAMVSRVKLRESLLARNKARFYPSLELEAAFNTIDELQDQPPDFSEEATTWYVKGIISLPLFQGGERFRNRDRLKAELNEIEFQRDDVFLGVARDIGAGVAELTAQAWSLHRFSRSDELSARQLAMVATDYEADRASLVEVLDARRNHLETRLQTLDARYGFYRAMAGIVHTVGWSADEAGDDFRTVFLERWREFAQAKK